MNCLKSHHSIQSLVYILSFACDIEILYDYASEHHSIAAGTLIMSKNMRLWLSECVATKSHES
jgi:hypothetical protein